MKDTTELERAYRLEKSVSEVYDIFGVEEV